MRWCVIGHPELGKTTAPESALPIHEGNGWQRLSDWADQHDAFNLADYSAPEATPDKPKPATKPKEK